MARRGPGPDGVLLSLRVSGPTRGPAQRGVCGSSAPPLASPRVPRPTSPASGLLSRPTRFPGTESTRKPAEAARSSGAASGCVAAGSPVETGRRGKGRGRQMQRGAQGGAAGPPLRPPLQPAGALRPPLLALPVHPAALPRSDTRDRCTRLPPGGSVLASTSSGGPRTRVAAVNGRWISAGSHARRAHSHVRFCPRGRSRDSAASRRARPPPAGA